MDGREMWFGGERGEVYMRSTAPGLVIASWYPRSPSDDGWPGSIVAVSEDQTFPLDEWEAGSEESIRGWLESTHSPWFELAG